MKLLLDQNLSPRLVGRLRDLFPHSSHVGILELDRASDAAVWEFARHHDFILVTRDVDFLELSALRGVPPRVIWLRLGNCTTTAVGAALRSAADAIATMYADKDRGVVIIHPTD